MQRLWYLAFLAVLLAGVVAVVRHLLVDRKISVDGILLGAAVLGVIVALLTIGFQNIPGGGAIA